MKKAFLSAVLVFSMVMCLNVQSIMAAGSVFLANRPGDVTFTEAWEYSANLYAYDSSAIIGELCCGFDTVLINEDYTWTYSDLYSHGAYVNGSSSSTVTKFHWAKMEVRHTGNTTSYGFIMNDSSYDGGGNFFYGDYYRTNHK